METTELIAMIREGVRGCNPGDTMMFPETGKIITVAEILEVANRLESLRVDIETLTRINEDWKDEVDRLHKEVTKARDLGANLAGVEAVEKKEGLK